MTDQPSVAFDAVLDKLAARVAGHARDAAIAEATADALHHEVTQLRARIDELEARLEQFRPQPTPTRPMPPESPDLEEPPA